MPILKQYYADQTEKLLKEIDAQYNIVRRVEGQVVTRDATAAIAIGDPDTTPKVEANNLLLRVLARLRSIDHVISEKNNETPNAIYSVIREKLKSDYLNLVAKIDEIIPLSISFAKAVDLMKCFEAAFNTNTLCDALHQAHLDKGCKSEKDYKKLLFVYRNFASLLEPTKTLVTVSYDEKNKVLHRITQYPITKKLEEQKKAILKMKSVTFSPLKDEKNYQSIQKLAIQEVNYYFADLLMLDDRMQCAQTRKTHMPGIKNAYLVKNELVFLKEGQGLQEHFNKAAEPANTQYFARSATPVYIGGGESDEDVQKQTRLNIDQVEAIALEKCAKNDLRIHMSCLVTDSPINKENVMVDHLYHATRMNNTRKNDMSYLPSNFVGTFLSLNIAPSLPEKGLPSSLPVRMRRAQRYRNIAVLSSCVRSLQDNWLDLVACASGQDRSETVAEYANRKWAKLRYAAHNKAGEDTIDSVRNRSRNSAEITSHVMHGSRGVKKVSRGEGLYSDETDQALYSLVSATTNKKNQLDKDQLKRVLEQPSVIATEEYLQAKEELDRVSQGNGSLQLRGQAVSAEVEKLFATGNQRHIGALIKVMQQTTIIVAGPKPNEHETYKKELQRYGGIVQGLQKKSFFNKLSRVMLALGGIALVAAGIIFAVPSCGTSILGAMIGTSMLLTYSGVTVAGLGLFAATRRKDLGGKCQFVSKVNLVYQQAKKELDLSDDEIAVKQSLLRTP